MQILKKNEIEASREKKYILFKICYNYGGNLVSIADRVFIHTDRMDRRTNIACWLSVSHVKESSESVSSPHAVGNHIMNKITE